MIRISRLASPDILTRKASQWRQRYLAQRAQKPNLRPPSKQYAHAEVVATLHAMSHGKCFYCETSLEDGEITVDHYVEVAEAPDKAFEWENLYLSCRGCQAKLKETQIPRAECLDPCDSTCDPAEHLAFEDELIRPRNGSARGRQTIRKYLLDRSDLDKRRLRQIKNFHRALLAIRERQLQDGAAALTAGELDILQRFARPEHPYSLMFRDFLERLSLSSS